MKEVLKNMKKILSLVLCLCMMLTALPLAAMAEDYKEPITLNVFSEVANFGGEQKGWFAKELKDRFNITLPAWPPVLWAISSAWAIRASISPPR